MHTIEKRMTNRRKQKKGPPVVPADGMVITEDVTFRPGEYVLPRGIEVAADGITVNGNGAVFVGRDSKGTGIQVKGRRGVTIEGFHLSDYYYGIAAEECSNLTIKNNRVTATAEVASDTVFLNIRLPAGKAYGGALWLHRVDNSTISGNNFEHNMCGILTYDCRCLSVKKNLVNYCSGFGVHLNGTCDSIFESNSADYCCRYNARNKGKGLKRAGHMGADAAGFLIVSGSHRNVFRRNFARLGGDGFFLTGSNPALEIVGANDNLFEENDGSWSPNIAFEATFSRGNVFRNNRADCCNYGFWLGYSTENVVEGNSIVASRQAGVAVENGWEMIVKGNTFRANAHGVLLWSHMIDERILNTLPEAVTSHDWEIVENEFTQNTKAIAIAANRDHGIRPLMKGKTARREFRPHDHLIADNEIRDNRFGVELRECDRTTIRHNTIRDNPEADIREYGCTDTTVDGNT